jgi:hypothetical protein
MRPLMTDGSSPRPTPFSTVGRSDSLAQAGAESQLMSSGMLTCLGL